MNEEKLLQMLVKSGVTNGGNRRKERKVAGYRNGERGKKGMKGRGMKGENGGAVDVMMT